MDPLYLLLASVLVAALLTFRLFIGSRHEGRHERRASACLESEPNGLPQNRVLKKPGHYDAVSIRLCNSPCKAAVRLRKKSFLVKDAPPLPLPACDRACNCEYQFHEDRRYPSAELDMAGGVGESKDSRGGGDRRRRVEPYQGIY